MLPASAPCFHIAVRKPVTETLIIFQRETLLGSKTVHCVEGSTACSIIEISRRTFTKRQSESLLTVRAP